MNKLEDISTSANKQYKYKIGDKVIIANGNPEEVFTIKECQVNQQGFKFYVLGYEYFEKCNENEKNPCLTPNYDVVGKLRRSFLKKNNYKIEE